MIGQPTRGCTMSEAPDHHPFTETIASRELVVSRHGQASRLLVEIGRPVRDVETVTGTDWRCPLRWHEEGGGRSWNALGIDAFQALQQAMETIRFELAELAAEDGVRLWFMDCPYDVQTQLPDPRHLRGAGGPFASGDAKPVPGAG